MCVSSFSYPASVLTQGFSDFLEALQTYTWVVRPRVVTCLESTFDCPLTQSEPTRALLNELQILSNTVQFLFIEVINKQFSGQ
jgi:hypothetical protein